MAGPLILSTHCTSKETDFLPEVIQLVTSKTNTRPRSPAPSPVFAFIYYAAMASSLNHLQSGLPIIRIKNTLGRVMFLFLKKKKLPNRISNVIISLSELYYSRY